MKQHVDYKRCSLQSLRIFWDPPYVLRIMTQYKSFLDLVLASVSE